MKICLIHNLYGQYARGGAETVVKKLAQGLQSQGHTVFVISGRPFGGWKSLKPEADIEDNMKVYRYYPLNLFFYADAANYAAYLRILWTVVDLFNFFSARQVKKILEIEGPDLILLNNLKGLSCYIARAINKLPAKKILILHDVQLVNPSGLLIMGREKTWLTDSFAARLYQIGCKFVFGGVANIISPSKFLLDFYSKYGFFAKAKKVVIPNPSIFEGGDGLNLSRAKMSGRPVLLFAGQVEKHKGINWLLDFLKKENFTAGDREVRFKVAGQGSEFENLKKMYPNVQWLGRIDRQSLKENILQANYLVFPSLCYENSPSIIYEALSLGLPIIAANIGGVPELVRDNENGFLFEAGNISDLKEALEKSLTLDDERYLNLSRQAIQSVASYNIENYLQRLLAI